jgi:hypothetical protein
VFYPENLKLKCTKLNFRPTVSYLDGSWYLDLRQENGLTASDNRVLGEISD